MTALIIVGAVLLLVAFLLAAPITVDASYGESSLRVCLRYLFLRFDLSPALLEKKTGLGEGKKPRRRKKKVKAKTEEDTAEKDKGALYAVESVWTLLRNSRKGFGILRRHLVFSRVTVYIAVGGEDAAEIALRYARINTLALALLDVLGVLFVLRPPTVGIAPVFTRGETHCELSLRAGIRPLFVLAVGASVLYHFMNHVTETKQKKKQTQGKGGNQHERAQSRQ